jgi:hypothetical protein
MHQYSTMVLSNIRSNHGPLPVMLVYKARRLLAASAMTLPSRFMGKDDCPLHGFLLPRPPELQYRLSPLALISLLEYVIPNHWRGTAKKMRSVITLDRDKMGRI